MATFFTRVNSLPDAHAAIGQRVRATENLNVRVSPSLAGSRIATEPTGSQGIILDGPVDADGYKWWRIQYDSGTSGWSAGEWLIFLFTGESSSPSGNASFSPTPPSISEETQSTDILRFLPGTRVKTTDRVRVRFSPSLTGKTERIEAAGIKGTLITGPLANDGYLWWRMRYDSGSQGWSAGDWLTVSLPEKQPTTESPSPDTPSIKEADDKDFPDPRTITERELFNKLLPKQYFSFLDYLQDFLISQNTILPSERTAIDAPDKETALFLKSLDFFKSQNALTDDDLQRLKEFLRDKYTLFRKRELEGLRRRMEYEQSRQTRLPTIDELLARALPKTPSDRYAAIPRNSDPINASGDQFRIEPPALVSLIQELGLKNILRFGARLLFGAKTAMAQIPGVPGWHTIPDCYKDLNPAFFVPGFNAWDACCNCGLFCAPIGCTFVPDCGPFGAACNTPLGCLNAICIGWPNAIYDYTTGICGCG